MLDTRPNILFCQADQLSASALRAYGNQVTKTPNIDRLFDQGVVFDNAYCNNPLCVPSRASMLTGLLGSSIDVYDNGSAFSSSTPTFVHYLRNQGYQTCLSGKMHFIGPDQLHGFEERLTTDIYPSDFIWTEQWGDRNDLNATALKAFEYVGPCSECRQLAYDDDASYRAERKLYEIAMGDDNRPFFLTLSLSNPHEPYLARKEFWDLYENIDIDLPKVVDVPDDQQDYHSNNLNRIYGFDTLNLDEQQLKNVRRAYYANVSYIDNRIGSLLNVLETSGLAENTIIIFTSDHGDMLGERGLWWKKHFFEDSSRVPLLIYAPGQFESKHVKKNVSLVDLYPTILESAGIDLSSELASSIDGNSLKGLLNGDDETWPDTVYCENFDGGTKAPMFMVRKGKFKYISCSGQPALLYDIDEDPNELNNLSGKTEFKEIEEVLLAKVNKRWNTKKMTAHIIQNQQQREFVHKALSKGIHTGWDYVPAPDTFTSYRPKVQNYYGWFGSKV